MPGPALVPLLIGGASAGASLIGSKMASNAAKGAARTQAQSADKAQQFNQQVYNDQRQMTAPYVNAGTQSLARLMAQHWGGSPQQYGLNGPQPIMPQGGGQAGPQGGGVPLGSFGSGGSVQMRAPDGSVRPVPMQMMEQFRAKGAQVVQ